MTTVTVDEAASARAEIAANNAGFSAAVSRRDPVGMAACYTQDARLLPPGLAALVGREAIEGFWSAGIAAGLTSVRMDTDALDVDGDRAIEVGRARVLVEPEDGETREGVGNYVVVHRREGDRWLWEIDIFNSVA